MGVPKFFRYISERYPCLSELINEYQIPEFDNLYLDMNGIIHMCSHPDDYDPHFRISEEKIFSDVFHYIEVLFRMIKPQKLFFMAVDGVAPRAKMNQQRGRRFRSAKEAEVLEAKAKERGEELPKEARFDSNCITPGTVFMARLHEQLKYFVSNKISNDRLWQHCKIILSGHETPGEGEHKIMDYIRYMKSLPGYDPNTRHCLYGLDADLIMLGLCSHEPHFSLLREEVRFGKKAKRKNIPEQINFYLLHLSLMREYLELEFLPLKDSLPFEYDMEKIIDDWVLMGFLVGNDFIPHLPNLHITTGALPVLYNAYMKILPTLDGYINEAGSLNLERFEKFMSALAAIDMDHFSEQYADLKYFCSKTGRRPNDKERTSYKIRELDVWQADECDLGVLEDIPPPTMNKELEALIKSTDDLLLGDPFLQSESPTTTKIIDLKLVENPELIVTAKIEDLMSEPITEVGSCATEDLMILLPSLENKVAASVEANPIPELEALIPALENKVAEITADEPLPILKKHTLLEPSESNLADLALEDVDLHFSEDEEDVSPYLSESDTEDDKTMNAEFLLHKNDYYMNKLDYTKVTPAVMRDQAEGYVRAIQWNLHYYYNGVCSWSWYYPHHYAPYISDIKDFADLKLEYDFGTPFHPFEQLLAVLPAASKTLLPEPYQKLMTSEDSKIINYYPQDFRTDLNGKKQEWEAVVLIPFIAEDLLLDAMAPCFEELSDDEIKRNTHGPMLVYEYTAENLGTYIAPDFFPSIAPNHAKLTPVTMEEIRIPIENLIKGPCPGSIHDVYYPGFPTLRHLKYSGNLEKAKVKVFDQPSQNENMIVKIISNEKNVNIENLATELLGRSVHVSWPHLIEGQVITVSDANVRYHKGLEPGKFTIEINKGHLGPLWYSQRNVVINHYKEKFGIEVGETSILIHVKIVIGRKYAYTQAGLISLDKQYAEVESCYPLQSVVQKLEVYESMGPKFNTIQELFPMGSTCFMIGHPHYGCLGEVIDNISLKSGRIKISMNVFQEPDLADVYLFEQEIKYMPGGAAAQRCAITPHLLSRITGTIFAMPGYKGNTVPKSSNKLNIGLNLKLNKKNEEIPGYTKKVDGQWLYTIKSVNLVRDYLQFCPELFSYMSSHMGNDVFFESELFPEEIGEGRIQKLIEWIKAQPFSQVERQKVGSKTVDIEIVKKIEEIVDKCNASQKNPKQVIMQVKPHLLYKPEIQTGHLPPDPSVLYKLYDRVVNVREGYTVPFGCKGTVIGIQTSIQTGNNGDENMEVMYDVVFDQQFAGGLQINCTANRGYRLPKTALINISHGMRQVQQKTVNPATNNPWYGKLPMNHQQQQHQQHHQQKIPPVQSQNSAFASWNPPNPNNFSRQHHQPPVAQQVPQPPMFVSQQMQHPAPNMPFGHPMNHHRIATPPRPQHNQPNRGVSAEFHAFLQDLQKNQGKAKPRMPNQSPNIVQSHVKSPQQVLGQMSPQRAPFNPMYNLPGTSPKSPQKQMTIPQQGGSSDETEALKKLLNISVTNDPTKQPSPLPSDVKNVTQQISVQDFFAHARINEQKMAVPKSAPNSPYFSVQLLNYCQAQRIGIPRYNYFSRNDKIRAQISLQDGRMVIGDESTTKEEATESAAKKLLTEGHQMPVNSPVRQSRPHPQPFMFQGPNIGPKGFPVPPKQWCQNSQRPQQQQQQKPQRPIMNKNSPSAKQPFPNKQITASHSNVRKQQHPKPDESKIGATPFVPLQAVKHRTKSGSSSSDTSSAKNNKNNSTSQINTLNNHVSKSKSATTPEKNSNQQTQSTSNTQPKQKVRKSRIAANFGSAPKSQK